MQKWSNKIQFPKENYILRVIGETFEPSKSSGNPMITLEFEVVSPESVQVAGEEYNVAGVQLKNYYPTIVYADADGNVNAEKTHNAQERVKTLFSLFGLPSDSINFENPELAFKGKLVHALLYPDAVERRKAPTAEDLKAGRRQGEVLKNPITGQPLISYYPKIDEIFGLASADPSKPF